MKHQRFSPTALAAALVLALTAGQAFTHRVSAADWDMDKSHSSLGFAVRHMMVSKVRGHFNDFKGKIEADENGKLTSVKGLVEAKSVDTRNDRRDEHLRSNDFFNSAKYPDINFESTKITWNSDTELTVTGKLTMRDVTKEVTLNGEFLGVQKVNGRQGPEQRMGYSFTGKLNRRDWGLNFNGIKDGVVMVSDTVELQLELEASRVL